MPRFRLSIRWWLAVAFAVVAAVTALAVAWTFSTRANGAFRDRAKELFAGTALVAAEEVSIAITTGVPPGAAVQDAALRHGVAMLLVDRRGRPLGHGGAPTGAGESRVDREALARALSGRRVIRTARGGHDIVVAIPMRSDPKGALLVRGTQPELPDELGIVHSRILEAALVAVLVGALAGLVIASLIALRLRRIAKAAATIAGGDFDQPLTTRFRDEVGSLTETVNTMRARLQASFGELASQRDRLHRLLDRLPEGVITADADLRVLFANSEAGRLIPGLVQGTLADAGAEVSDLVRTLFERDATPVQERIAPDASHVIEVLAIPPTSSADYAIVVLTDISERERLEQAEREFVANASHELRTPLTTILGAVDALQAGAKDEPHERDRFVGLIEREARRLARLARALLVLARAQTDQEPVRLRSVEVAPLLHELAAHVETAPEVDVTVECPAGLRVLADAELLEQALTNLAENAAKFTERGRVALSADHRGGEVVIAVSDTGPGIEGQSQRRILERFQRLGGRDAESFGLGLAIVQQAVRVLGGKIALRSQPGRGTTVSISLPAEREVLAA